MRDKRTDYSNSWKDSKDWIRMSGTNHIHPNHIKRAVWAAGIGIFGGAAFWALVFAVWK